MKKTQKLILRTGLGITFVWIGILILKDPAGWGGFIASWAQNLLIAPIEKTMIVAGWGDILIGILLMMPWKKTILAGAFLAAIHLLIVVLTIGPTWSIIARDLGLFAMAVSLILIYWPNAKNLQGESSENS